MPSTTLPPFPPAGRPETDPARQELVFRVRLLAPLVANLRPPQPRPGIVERPALAETLDGSEGVVLVTAPAGYGKTSLLAQWARRTAHVGWLTVTPEADDVAVLVGYVARALDTIEPLRTDELAAVTEAGVDGATVLLPRLARVVSDRPSPFGLVLDDVHRLQSPECIHAIEVLIQHLPPGAKLVLSGRHAPPLARGRLRTQRSVVELGPDDLALPLAEAIDLLRHAGLEVDASAAAVLVEQTGGWPAGLYIAAMAALAERDAGMPDTTPRADHPLVAQYIQEQVIDGLPADDVEFLTRTSIIERLDAPCCDALLGRRDSGLVLARLAATNLLVVPVNSTAVEYRHHHHLFVAALRSELRRREPDAEPELHRRASVIYEERSDPGAAIRHALWAGDPERAALLVWVHAPAMLNTGRTATVEGWLGWFAEAEFDRFPELCVSMALCCVTAPESRPVTPWVDLARRADPEVRLADGSPLAAAVAVLDAISGDCGVTAMVEAATHAVDCAGQEHVTLRAVASYLVGSGHVLLGRFDEARRWLEETVQLSSVVSASAAHALAQMAFMAARDGDWHQAHQTIARAAALTERFELSERPLLSDVKALRALVAAHEGDAPSARRHVTQARQLVVRVDHIAPWLPIQVRIVLAWAELELDEPAAASQLVREAEVLLARLPDSGILRELLAEVSVRAAEAHTRHTALVNPLTTAELRVLSYLPTHLSYQAIAEDLIVSRNTVKSHALAIFRKLGVPSRADAVARARDIGLLDEQP